MLEIVAGHQQAPEGTEPSYSAWKAAVIKNGRQFPAFVFAQLRGIGLTPPRAQQQEAQLDLFGTT